jgi:hypothetical protein
MVLYKAPETFHLYQILSLGYDGPLQFSMAEGSPDSVNPNPASKISSREDIDLEDEESSPVAEPSEEMLPMETTQSEGSFGHMIVRLFLFSLKASLVNVFLFLGFSWS